MNDKDVQEITELTDIWSVTVWFSVLLAVIFVLLMFWFLIE